MSVFVRHARKIIVVSVVVVLVVITMAVVSAQNDTGDNAPLPEPHENMSQFDWFLGEWEVVSRILVDAETDEWLEETLRTVHTSEMNGHIIFEHFVGPLGGEPYEAWSIRKYNANSDRWQQKWMDTSTPFIANWGGTFNAEEGEYVGYNEFFLDENYEMKGDTAAREVFFDITDDSFSWRYESTRDGGETWTVGWTLEYTRIE